VKSLAIARTTFLETIRQPAYVVVVLAGTALSFALSWITWFGFGREYQIVRESGLSGAVMVGFLVILITVPVTIAEEIRSRQILAVLAKPISELSLVVGKFFGLALALALSFGLMYAALTLSLWIKEGWLAPLHTFSHFFLGYLQVLIMAGITLFFSVFLPLAATIILAFMIYMGGNLLVFFAEKTRDLAEPAQSLVQGVLWLFPDLVRLNTAFDFGAGRSPTVFYLIIAGCYALLYTAVALYATGIVLSRKELL